MGSLYKRPGSKYWWIKYGQNGRTVRESSGTTKETQAKRLLRLREGDVERGIPVSPKMGRVTVEEAAQDIENDYIANGRKSLRGLRQRLRLHLLPYFRGRRLGSIRVSDVLAYVAQRQAAKASNGQINRELTALKRMFSLAVKGEKLMTAPHIPLLREAPARSGFLEREQINDVCSRLEASVAAVVRFAYFTGWRVHSEVLPLRWHQVDFAAGEVRLEAGTTKSGEPRVFPLTSELYELLEGLRDARDDLRAKGTICPHVFHRGGRPIRSFIKAWRTACTQAGCPGRIPHDLRRTAVRNLERAGVPRSTAMAMVGHQTEAIYRRYAIVDPVMRREAAAKLDAFARGHTSRHRTPSTRPTGTDKPKNS